MRKHYALELCPENAARAANCSFHNALFCWPTGERTYAEHAPKVVSRKHQTEFEGTGRLNVAAPQVSARTKRRQTTLHAPNRTVPERMNQPGNKIALNPVATLLDQATQHIISRASKLQTEPRVHRERLWSGTLSVPVAAPTVATETSGFGGPCTRSSRKLQRRTLVRARHVRKSNTDGTRTSAKINDEQRHHNVGPQGHIESFKEKRAWYMCVVCTVVCLCPWLQTDTHAHGSRMRCASRVVLCTYLFGL